MQAGRVAAVGEKMAELPENLQVIKTERLTPERSPNSNMIKERLNLHVKRRLQQEHQQETQQRQQLTMNNTATAQQRAAANMHEDVIAAPSSKRKEKQQQHGQKEPTKTRRPYQKRTDKNTSKTQTQTTAENGGRKNKRHKGKQSLGVGMAEQVAQGSVGDGTTGSVSSVGQSNTGVGSAEDGGSGDGNELDSREMSTRDKEKCPDILGMVLSVKKRALMADPEVQAFLGQVMNAFKS